MMLLVFSMVLAHTVKVRLTTATKGKLWTPGSVDTFTVMFESVSGSSEAAGTVDAPEAGRSYIVENANSLFPVQALRYVTISNNVGGILADGWELYCEVEGVKWRDRDTGKLLGTCDGSVPLVWEAPFLPTQAPESPAPDTRAPGTSTPATATPATAAPSSSAPLTPQPHVHVQTASPQLQVGATLAPAVAQPLLPPPAPPPPPESARRLSEVAAGISVLSASPSTAIAAGRLAVSMGPCAQHDTLPRPISPLGLATHGPNGALVGCVLGNAAIVVCVGVLHLLACHVCSGCASDLLAAQGLLRFPSWSLFAVAFFYQGFASCGATLLVSPEGLWQLLLGVLSVVGAACFPVAAAALVRRCSTRLHYQADPQANALTRFVAGPAEWLDLDPAKQVVNRYGTLFHRFKPPYLVFLSAECWLSLALGFIEALAVGSEVQCGHKCVAMLLLHAGFAALVWNRRPSRRPRDDYLQVLDSASIGSGLAALAEAHYAGDAGHWGFEVAGWCFGAASVLLAVRALLDLLTAAYIVATRRREALADLPRLPSRSWSEKPASCSLYEASTIPSSDESEAGDGSGCTHASFSSPWVRL